MQEEILIPIAFFTATFGILYVYFTTRNKERLAMIEKGADASLFSQKKGISSLKAGIVAVGVSIGILLGQVLHINYEIKTEVATLSMVFLFAGLGLVIEHFITKKQKDQPSK